MKNKHYTHLLLTGLLALLLATSCADQHFARKHLELARKEGPYDVIIVTGLPYRDSTSASGVIFAARILWAKYLYDHGIAKNIIFSGAAVSSRYYEGLAMKIVADSLGIPPSHTFAEIKAEHSTENVWYGMKMAQQLGFKKIALAADPFQTKMLRKFLKVRCNNMPYIPIVYDSVIADRNKWQSLMPAQVDCNSAVCKDFVALAERESFAERFRGTRGKHIKFDE
jgi:uncharacterized SAM-binding protein YcdF (DUF218 family)